MPMPEPESPNDILSALIVQHLVDGGLILDSHTSEFAKKFKTGRASQDDWKLWVELANATETQAREENGNG